MQLPNKVPADHEGTYYNIPVYSDCSIKEPWAQVTVRVYSAEDTVDFRKSSLHRIMVVCGCGNHVPFGRMHQHAPACDEAPEANVLAIWERIDRLRQHGRTWQEIEIWLEVKEPWIIWEVVSQLSEDDKNRLRRGEATFAEMVIRAH
jgi:hypothetical protein